MKRPRHTNTTTHTSDTLKKANFKNIKTLKMARVPCKHLLLVAFLLLCFFISLSHGARSLGVTSVVVDDQKMKGKDVLDHHQVLKPTEENGGVAENIDEDLVSVDYTPARRKPPIHN